MIPAVHISAFRASLFAGKYNLLLGSGISLSSRNDKRQSLESAEALRERLCTLKNLGIRTSLSRAFGTLSTKEQQTHVTEHYSGCVPSAALSPMVRYLWRRLFTFNIDDVIEAVYENAATPAQRLVPKNFDAPYQPAPERDELQAIHLHGWVREASRGFVFSHTEYARMIAGMNPWMHLLSQVLGSDPFIISGTSLSEVDLEYYISFRTTSSPRRGSGPSILIVPDPDAATEADCQRHNLLLVQGTFEQFLEWVAATFPNPPTVTELVIPSTQNLFSTTATPRSLLTFFDDFRLLNAGETPRGATPSRFFYGRPPEQDDLDRHLDVTRHDSASIGDRIQLMLRDSTQPRMLLVLDEAGTGKSTLIGRVAHDVTRLGTPVLSLRSLSKIDVDNTIRCLSALTTSVVVLVDGVADHASQVAAILENPAVSRRVVVLAAERVYRRDLIDLAFATIPLTVIQPRHFSIDELVQLIELFRQFGLIGDHEAIHRPAAFAARLVHDPVAISVCRILSDFKPLDKIIDSLWNESAPEYHLPYICVAIARYCHSSGVLYSLLQSACGPRSSLTDMFTNTVPLRLADHPENDEYVIPLNAVVAERVLHRATQQSSGVVFSAFLELAKALAPHVNRMAIIHRSPEARLAQRLFDSDKVAKPMLGDRTEEWYVACQSQWGWNSRYWEQRALLVSDQDIESGLQYARHAVAIEIHPFTLTTLGKILLRKSIASTSTDPAAFNEAFRVLARAISMEESRSRISVHPYSTLLSGISAFLEHGGSLSSAQQTDTIIAMDDARGQFRSDPGITSALNRLERLLNGAG